MAGVPATEQYFTVPFSGTEEKRLSATVEQSD
jgi:hypothetical protein